MKLHLNLQKRLLIAFLAMLALVISASLASFLYTLNVRQAFVLTQSSFSNRQTLMQLQYRWQDVSQEIDRLFATRQVDEQESRLKASVNDFNTELENIAAQAPAAENQPIYDELRAVRSGTVETVTEILRLAENGQWAVARDLRESVLTAQQAEFNGSMRELSKNIEQDAVDALLLAERSQSVTRYVTIAITLLAIAAAVLLSQLSTQSIINPLNQLIKVVQRVTLRDFSPVVPLAQVDEIGDLSQSIALMTDWLRQSYESLEERVADRTSELERQNQKIQVAAEVARDASSARDLDNLLSQSVKLIVDRFGFYHAGIFLLDENHEYAVLRAASGPAGQVMVSRGHRLRVGEVGIVGHVAGSGKARIALDVGVDAVHFQNPLLPDTHSEMALPLKVGSHVLGVLDVQSEETSAFRDDDINVLQILSDLLAVGIHNAQLDRQIQQSYLELERLYGQYTEEAWREVVHNTQVKGYQYDRSGLHPISAARSNSNGNQDGGQPDVAIPLLVRGEEIGALNIWSGDNKLPPEDIELLQDLGLRLSQSLDSARLFTETQKRAERERLSAQAASKMRESLNVDSVLKTAAEDIYRLLNLASLTIDLSATKNEEGNVLSVQDRTG